MVKGETAQEGVRRLRCPRCGYDVSGVVDTWRESCPLEGVCSECGLRFEWCDIFDPGRTTPVWFFEAAERRLLRAFLSSAMRAMIPWTFWKRVRLSHAVRPVRLALFALVALVLMWMTITACAIYAGRWDFSSLFANPITGQFEVRWAYILTALIEDSDWFLARPTREDLDFGALLFQPLAIYALAFPLCFLIIGDTLAKIRVRAGHIWRPAVYNTAAIGAFYVLFVVAQSISEAVLRLSWRTNRVPDWLYQLSWKLLEGDTTFAALALVWAPFVWWLTCRRYLRLPNAMAVIAIFAIIALLLTIAYYLFFTNTTFGIIFRDQW